MAFVIPTSTQLTDYRQVTELDGRDYVLRILYNTREDRFYLSIADQDDEPVVSGVKIVAEIDLLRLVTDERRPPGKLVARDYSAPDPVDWPATNKLLSEDPGLGELGGRVLLLYFPIAEVNELGL